MHVIFWGTYDTGKPRVRILADGLRKHGLKLQEIHASPWDGVEDKSQLHSWRSRVAILRRWVFAYPPLVWRLLWAPRPDFLLIGYPGILDILVAAPIARIKGVPIVWDVFLSMYDTVCEDRKLLPRNGFAARVLRNIEGFALRRADIVFMDTQAHARRLEMLFNLSEGSCDAIWVGVEPNRFPPQPPHELADRPLRVLFYGQFIPLHGVQTIVSAARLLRHAPVQWQLIGRGQESASVRALLEADPLPNVAWTEWVEYGELQRHIGDADLCLGIFGTSDKAASVIPNKVFQIVASGRPLVTRDSPAIRELLTPGVPCVRLVEPGNPHDLADAVMDHYDDLKNQDTPTSCHHPLLDRINAGAIGQQFLDMIRRRQDRR